MTAAKKVCNVKAILFALLFSVLSLFYLLSCCHALTSAQATPTEQMNIGSPAIWHVFFFSPFFLPKTNNLENEQASEALITMCRAVSGPSRSFQKKKAISWEMSQAQQKAHVVSLASTKSGARRTVCCRL